ncbi:hypothetical protein BKA70DRAFT_1445727 [Coprinopsis sp. MPI-PUGE-AT-0042]|nr:hypothetical protein BKA70DRAFT_1445727 [Coprinopsis sp. MPI-PUGE-AT-0042]
MLKVDSPSAEAINRFSSPPQSRRQLADAGEKDLAALLSSNTKKTKVGQNAESVHHTAAWQVFPAADLSLCFPHPLLQSFNHFIAFHHQVHQLEGIHEAEVFQLYFLGETSTVPSRSARMIRSSTSGDSFTRIRAEAYYHPEESDKFTGRRWGISILYDFIHALAERDTRRGYIGWHGHHGGIPLATSKERYSGKKLAPLQRPASPVSECPEIAALLRLLVTGALSIVPQHDYYSDTPGLSWDASTSASFTCRRHAVRGPDPPATSISVAGPVTIQTCSVGSPSANAHCIPSDGNDAEPATVLLQAPPPRSTVAELSQRVLMAIVAKVASHVLLSIIYGQSSRP